MVVNTLYGVSPRQMTKSGLEYHDWTCGKLFYIIRKTEQYLLKKI